MKLEEVVKQLDSTLGVLYKYELHAGALVIVGATLCLKGHTDVGFSLVTAGTTIFKGKSGG